MQRNHKKSKDAQASTFCTAELLADETLLHIFSFLAPEDRSRASGVSRRWHNIAQDHDLSYISNGYQENYHKNHLIASKNQLIKIQQAYQAISAFLTKEPEKIIRLGVAGEKASRNHLSHLKNRTPIKIVNIREMAEKTKVRLCDLILFCPDPARNPAKEIKDFLFKLHWYQCNPIVFVLDIECESDYLQFIHLQPHDTIKTLYSRMLNSLYDKQNELTAKLNENAESKPVYKVSRQCVLS